MPRGTDRSGTRRTQSHRAAGDRHWGIHAPGTTHHAYDSLAERVVAMRDILLRLPFGGVDGQDVVVLGAPTHEEAALRVELQHVNVVRLTPPRSPPCTHQYTQT